MKTTQPLNRSYFIETLENELERRIRLNPRYSLRAFAKALGVNPGGLSQILSGKKIPTLELAERIAEKIDLRPNDRIGFLDSLVEKQRSRKLQRVRTSVKRHVVGRNAAPLALENFKIIGDWYHFAILELTYAENFKSDPQWIAKQLGITLTQTKLAIQRLLSLGLMSLQNGELTKTQRHLETKDRNITTPALKQRQKQVRELAIQSLENDPLEKRSMTSVTMCIDPSLLPEAKKKIDKFNDELCEFLESGRRKEVYVLETSLFTVQKGKNT